MSQDGNRGVEGAPGLVRALGLGDATMIVAGSMIGSGIFITSADVARQVGSSGWILVTWSLAGLLTLAAALSYGELCAMMPRVGGQYVFLREAYSPLCGFLFGWTFFLVMQTGTLAAVAIGFAKFAGLLVPAIAPDRWIIAPIDLSSGYAVSLSVQQLVAILLIAFLTFTNTRGLRLGKLIQNVFTSAKLLALAGLIVVGVIVGRNNEAIAANFTEWWSPQGADAIRPELAMLPTVTASGGWVGLIVALGVGQVGALFAADSWAQVTFTAGEVRRPRRNLPLALALGVGLVIVLYLLANLGYLLTLSIQEIQRAPDDRVATAVLAKVLGTEGALIMAVAVMISTFGCNNGLTLAGARVYYAMARDGLFFKAAGRLNRYHVPAVGLIMQGIWACVLLLPRTRRLNAAGQPVYGNVYGNLLDYLMFAMLVFYVLSILAVFVLRRKRPDAPRPYRAFGYPVVPALYLVITTLILVVLLLYRTQTTWPGLAIVLAGIPVYLVWSRFGGAPPPMAETPEDCA